MCSNPSRKQSLLSQCSFTDEQDEHDPSQPNFGLLFDIDGVLARGLNPMAEAKDAFKLLCNNKGELVVPVAFVTNGCSDSVKKAQAISNWFDVEISPDQVIHAPTPLTSFKLWHDKRILFIGQANVTEIASRLGFTNIVLIDEVRNAFPHLDIVDHTTRGQLASGYSVKPFKKIDAIILIGEPTLWESRLQLIVDLLVTDGQPDKVPTSFPESHLPIFACNMDLVFMAEAPMPRFGHGAFLTCLESLYEKITGNRLTYTALIGKPSEITYRYAEHILSLTARRMGMTKPLQKVYFFGDNPEVDILGANLYNNYLRRYRRLIGRHAVSMDSSINVNQKAAVASSRAVPAEACFIRQSVRAIESILVHTGVYKPTADDVQKKPNYCHRDFTGAADLMLPNAEFYDVYDAMNYVMRREQINPNQVVIRKPVAESLNASNFSD